MSDESRGGGNHKLRVRIRRLEGLLAEAVEAYTEVCGRLYDVALVGTGRELTDELPIPEDGDVVALVQGYIAELKATIRGLQP